MLKRAESVPAGCEGLVMLPYLLAELATVYAQKRSDTAALIRQLGRVAEAFATRA